MKAEARRHSAEIRSTTGTLLTTLVVMVCLAPLARAQKKGEMRSLFEHAVKMRTELESQPPKERTLEDYKKVVAGYRKIYLTSPQTDEVTPSLIAVAELYQEMGRQFDAQYFDASIVTYHFLLKEYPNSRYKADALFTIAQIQQQDLNRLDDAESTYKEFLKRYPHSDKAEDARDALQLIAEAREIESHPNPAANAQLAEERENDSRMPRVTNIRSWNADSYTRIVVDLEDTVKYESARITSPDRIYFDLYEARLSPTLSGKTFEVANGFLKAIRVAQNKAGVVRLVLDVDSVKEYSAFLLPNPYRLVIDVHGQQPVNVASRISPPTSDAKDTKVAAENNDSVAEHANGVDAKPPLPRPTETLPIRKATAREAGARASLTPAEPKPTHDGQHSLTRALGLKINRIVVDPGHGGHDMGTIGPHGLAEKDLCLDVALRLGRLIQEKLPAAQVVYTRKDDTFVPLEARTAIANQAKADLFISIHANSSQDRNARGVETYYLNFATSQEAMEVATRENALSQTSLHDLQDMIRKIARNEKIEESKELAGDIQDSLAKRLQQISHSERSRGVKKAPFVVLIGADMPSVLTEISFLSNPNDEKLLKKPEQRQRVAEGLFRGVSSYLVSLNSLSYNQQRLVSARHASSLASELNPK